MKPCSGNPQTLPPPAFQHPKASPSHPSQMGVRGSPSHPSQLPSVRSSPSHSAQLPSIRSSPSHPSQLTSVRGSPSHPSQQHQVIALFTQIFPRIQCCNSASQICGSDFSIWCGSGSYFIFWRGSGSSKFLYANSSVFSSKWCESVTLIYGSLVSLHGSFILNFARLLAFYFGFVSGLLLTLDPDSTFTGCRSGSGHPQLCGSVTLLALALSSRVSVVLIFLHNCL